MNMLLVEIFLFITQNNIRQQFKNNKLKIIAPIWNGEFELPDCFYSVSDIQDYIDYIDIYINRINNRLVFKIKDKYRLELQTPEMMMLYGSTKKLIDKTKMEKIYQVYHKYK